MTIETFMMTVKIIMVLNGVIALLSFLFYKRRATQIKLLGLNFLYQIVGYYSMAMFDLKGMEVNIPGNIQLFFAFLTITAIYYTQFQKRYTRFFLVVTILYLVFAFVNVFFIQKMYVNSYTVAFLDFAVMVYCILYFYRLLIELPAQHLQMVPMFWISTSFLVQSAGDFFLFMFTAYLTKFFFNDVLIYWTIHNLLLMVHGLLIIVGVSVDLKNTISPSRKGQTGINAPSTR